MPKITQLIRGRELRLNPGSLVLGFLLFIAVVFTVVKNMGSKAIGLGLPWWRSG